jgi:outer membrane protein OmpA-like peptidoglycan-associated protein
LYKTSFFFKNNMTRNIFFRFAAAVSLLLAALTFSLQAQTPEGERSLLRFGVWGQGTMQMHSTRFIGLASLPELAAEQTMKLTNNLTNNPYGWGGGVVAEFPLLEFGKGASLGFAARVGVSSFAAQFSSLGDILPSVRVGYDEPVTPEYRLSTNLLMLTGEPLLTFRFADNRVAIMAGAQFTMPLRETTLQSIKLLSDTPISDDIRKANEASEQGSLGRSITPSLLAGIAWEIPLTANGAWLLVPEVFYSFGLANISNTLLALPGETPLWRMNTLRAGIALKFAPPKPEPPKPESPKPEPVKPELVKPEAPRATASKPSEQAASTAISVKIASVIGVKRSGQGVDYPTFGMEEFPASSSRYLLPYIFFDEKSSAIPQRYTRLQRTEIDNFSPENLVSGALKPENELDAYYHLLNIVGFRLRKYPTAQLTLTGFNDAAAESADKPNDGKPNDGKSLSLRRAERVKEYLQSVWGIPTSRIVARSGGTRGLADAVDAEENRVVEMQATEPHILDELRYDYTLFTLTPPVVEVQPDITAPKGLAAWSLKITQDDDKNHKNTLIAEYDGKFAPTVVSANLERAALLRPLTNEPLVFTLRAADRERNSSFATVQLPVKSLTLETKRQMNLPDVRVGTYWVFCFDLNSKQILVDDRIRRAVQAIKTHITPGATLEIKGYADTRGKVLNNRKLSDERAEAVLQLINAPASRVVSVEGKGESTFYDNDLPEGRFYNRFVRVDVRTPVATKR